jgi:hypothetical protein
MKLYRGDKILNESTNPGIYRNNGIRSKAFGSGASPANIELQGLLQSITKHVKPATKEDIVYYDVTDFISFSENQERARYWCSDRGTLILEECQDFLETRYIFTMDISDSELQNHGNGIYSFKYKCNPLLKGSDVGNFINEAVIRAAAANQECPHCFQRETYHFLILINSLQYLTSYPDHEKIKGAIEFAKADQEWLLLPCDKLGMHRTTRIPRADFWSATHFSVIGENRPEMNCL